MFDQVYSNGVLFSPIVQVPHPVRKWPAISRTVTALAGRPSKDPGSKVGMERTQLVYHHLIFFPFLWLSYILSPELLQICFEAELSILKSRHEMITRN